MLSTTWTQAEVTSNREELEGIFYRLISKDASNSTAKVTDTIDEIDLLENLVKESRANTPVGEYEKYDPLLIRPFFTPPFLGGSRFGSETGFGVFYCAETIETVAAERGYYVQKFRSDSPALALLQGAHHSLITVHVKAQIVDVRVPPFKKHPEIFLEKSDYSGTQNFANVVRFTQVNGIVYTSVRNPNPSSCLALLSPRAFKKKTPTSVQDSWVAIATENSVRWINNSVTRGSKSLQFTY